MKKLAIRETKYVALSIAMLFSGVFLSGAIVYVLDNPAGEDEYLHDHLTRQTPESEIYWADVNMGLPAADRQALARIIKETERPDWVKGPNSPLVGQALEAAIENACDVSRKSCSYPLRVNRILEETEVNLDLRVTNIRETNFRVNIEADTDQVSLLSLSEETRQFRFYQTQNGWIQKTSEIISDDVIVFEDRTEKFREKFANPFTGINYYPATASWNEFWREFPVEKIAADLDTIRDLNANSVRIFLNHAYFDSGETREEAIQKLRTFLDLCRARNIQALVTLFDLRPNYALYNLGNDIRHIDSVLSNVSDHPAILGIDLKNQPDLDFENWGEGQVETWLTTMTRHLQMTYPAVPVTIGWSSADQAKRLTNVVDFVTYHEYENPKGFETRLEEVIQSAQGKAVMITEVGSTTWRPPFPAGMAESKQASRLNAQLENSSNANGIFVWTLHDFEHVSSDVVGIRPWRKAQQKHFGLIRSDGSTRPAFDILKTHAETRSTRSPQLAQNY